MTFAAKAQYDGLFKWNDCDNEYFREQEESLSFQLPAGHGLTYDSNGAPLGSGIAVFAALGMVYALNKTKISRKL